MKVGAEISNFNPDIGVFTNNKKRILRLLDLVS